MDPQTTSNDRGGKISSYQKGINNLLTEMEKFEALIWTYVLRVNSNFYSKEFPTTQIAKIILTKLNLEKTRFPIFHKVIRIILSNWEKQGVCELLPKGNSSNSKKKKEVYRFKEEGLEKIKAKFIDKCIENIINDDALEKELQILKTREKIIDDMSFDLVNIS
ncbi:MAG: hypothetical protein ACTSUE_01730 [Promethearchaeota archaeon]